MADRNGGQGRIGILECGRTPAGLAERFGSYDAMTRRMLQQGSGTGWGFERYAVLDGVLPERAGACDGYVITGSAAGVYEDLFWIEPLLEFLRAAKGRAALVGICFGHQAMAQAFGGRVEKSERGWGIGLHEYRVVGRPGWMGDDAGHRDTVRAAASHQDQVVQKPPGAAVVVQSGFTPFAGLDYGDAVSFQFHPEFAPDYARALIEAWRERHGDAAAEAAMSSYAIGDDRARVAGWIGRFLLSSVAARQMRRG